MGSWRFEKSALNPSTSTSGGIMRRSAGSGLKKRGVNSGSPGSNFTRVARAQHFLELVGSVHILLFGVF